MLLSTRRALCLLLPLTLCLAVVGAAEDAPVPEPTEFAFVFSPGYGTIDHFPSDPAVFENFLVNMKRTGFNTIHCVYRDWRLPLCRKHGVKMMIDVLAWKEGAETGIRRPHQRATVEAICKKVRGDEGVWGYNLWNEKLDYFGRPDGKDLDAYLAMIREWDPTHPVWVGTYRNYYINLLKGNPGVFGYYDYHWQRGMNWHFADLEWYRGFANQRGAHIGRWIMGSDYNRNSFTLNTSIAYGLKVVIWFIGAPFDARGNVDEKHRFHHLVRIGEETHNMYPELMKLGRPAAVYSTATSRAPDNRDKDPGIPAHTKPFPDDHWLRVKQGEAVAGFFAYPDGGDAVYFANHNAFAWQGMVIALAKQKDERAQAWQFDRKVGGWAPFEPGDLFSFPISPGGGELFRFVRGGAE